jgi:starch synthase (maltosyl-transferring)
MRSVEKPPPPRVVIEGVTPEVDGGRFPAKRAAGERVVVEADVFADGHDLLSCELLYRHEEEPEWLRAPMSLLVNDRWRGEFRVERLGAYLYTLRAWPDAYATWARDLEKRLEAGQDVALELKAGADLLRAAAGRAGDDRARSRLEEVARVLDGRRPPAAKAALALAEDVIELAGNFPEEREVVVYERQLRVIVDRPRARFSTWYEMFPRSCSAEPLRHGTLRDCARLLPYIADMGFDVLYLPPIHPIGITNRKGRNNAVVAAPDDQGSPWAIGSAQGGHKAVHPLLGTLADLRALVADARGFGIEVALDIAFQCSPDHPYVREHPQWFRRRPDGRVRFAENPPKKYEDIYPFDFETPDWRALWEELKSIILFWLEQGVSIFRVDNPHTKPFRFWEWLIGEVRREHPEVIFLSEAFTRPKVMYRLAKLGFNQSYTYFAWRNAKWELTEYLTELTRPPIKEYFRPSLWPNTPDILTEYLQFGGRPAFIIRYVLAATLGASCGIYGPAFELLESRPREPGSEEYLNAEKYEVRRWDRDHPESIREVIARVNQIRRATPALQSNDGLRFHGVDNEQLICYSKQSENGENTIIVVVNLDPHHRHAGWTHLDLGALGLPWEEPFQVHDLLGDAHYIWQGPRNYVELDPHAMPAHVFAVRRHLHREQDFDYYA